MIINKLLFLIISLPLISGLAACQSNAPNITAIGFIRKDINSKRKIFYNGVIYALGRSITYVGIGFILIMGANQMQLSMTLSVYGEMMIGPLLLVIGFFMLDVIKISLPGIGSLSERFEKRQNNSSLHVLLLGVFFALAFCPYSGVLYFGALIPMSIGSGQGLPMLFIFALATGLPVIIFSWMIAFTVNKVGHFYNRMKSFEIWFRKVIAVLFIIVGIYYTIIIYF